MAENYIVYVAALDQPPSPEARERLRESLGLDESKLDALLRRLPGQVTKAVPESTALSVARRFRDAGLQASIQPPADSGQNSVDTPPASTSPTGPAAGGVGTERAEKDYRADDTHEKGELTPRVTTGTDVEDEAEDQLFPPSAFSKPEGPKAPSKPLLFALLAVLVLLAIMWLLF